MIVNVVGRTSVNRHDGGVDGGEVHVVHFRPFNRCFFCLINGGFYVELCGRFFGRSASLLASASTFALLWYEVDCVFSCAVIYYFPYSFDMDHFVRANGRRETRGLFTGIFLPGEDLLSRRYFDCWVDKLRRAVVGCRPVRRARRREVVILRFVFYFLFIGYENGRFDRFFIYLLAGVEGLDFIMTLDS